MYGAPKQKYAKRIMLLGSGELGKEVCIEAQRLGVETIAVDRYVDAPAMQVAHRSYVVDMLDGEALRKVILEEDPDLIVPEIEAIATEVLVDLEEDGHRIIPTARAARLTMDREGIRRLAAETLKLPTAKYRFANTEEELRRAAEEIGFPCIVKPVMSSSGKGQSMLKTPEEVPHVWNVAQNAGRVQGGRVIVEELIHFESEITLLTVRSVSGTHFCAPIGHRQADGDYIESWQPHHLTRSEIEQAENIAVAITEELGGYGVFGVELFITQKGVVFSEVSPRPHDTGMVTMVTQDLSEFALHVRAILGLPIAGIHLVRSGASHALKSTVESTAYQVDGLQEALSVPGTQIRLFGKPKATPGRRIGVVLNHAESVSEARKQAAFAAAHIQIVE